MARVLWHDDRSLIPSGLLLGALSLGDIQDCIISGLYHSGALALRDQRKGWRSWGMLYGTVMISAKKIYDVIFLLERII